MYNLVELTLWILHRTKGIYNVIHNITIIQYMEMPLQETQYLTNPSIKWFFFFSQKGKMPKAHWISILLSYSKLFCQSVYMNNVTVSVLELILSWYSHLPCRYSPSIGPFTQTKGIWDSYFAYSLKVYPILTITLYFIVLIEWVSYKKGFAGLVPAMLLRCNINIPLWP